MKELGTNVQLLPNHTTPQKSDTYFNRKMKTNRLARAPRLPLKILAIYVKTLAL